MLTRMIWNYFSFNIIKYKGVEQIKDITALSENKLKNIGFSSNEIILIQTIYKQNRTDERINEIMDDKDMTRIISRFLYAENRDLSQPEFISMLHQYNINYSESTGHELYESYKSIQKR